MSQPIFSIVVPAYNEERFLPKCLDAIERAQGKFGEAIEIIVVDNLSTDRTVAIAEERGARIVQTPVKCLAAVRNVGVAASTGKYVCTIDSDSFMSENMLVHIKEVMDSGRYVGGGVANFRTDRLSTGIILSHLMLVPIGLAARISCVMFYTTKEHFDAVGGFNEKLLAAEDGDFALRLKRYGRTKKLRFKNILKEHVITSARKFDEYGDWYMFRHPLKVLRTIRQDPDMAKEIWYKERRHNGEG
jgi:glycosyltransferase involved in cell wall biosynthesis